MGPGKGAKAVAYFPVYEEANPKQMLGFGKFL